MEQEKSTVLKLVYIALLGVTFYICRYLFIYEVGLPIYSLGVFGFVILGLYITDNMEFTRYKSSNKGYVIIFLLNFIAFFIWFIDAWDFGLIPFFLIFTASQVFISTIISIVTFKIKNLTTYGTGEMKNRIVESLSNFPEYKYIDEAGRKGSLTDFIKEKNIRILIITKLKLTKEEIKEILNLKLSGVEVKSYSDYMLENEAKIDVEFIDEEWLLQAYGFKILHSHIQTNIKRIFDITMAFIIGILTLPIMGIAAIIVKLESPGPIIYSQDRVGENGKEFKVHKFRSMRNDAEKDGAKWAQKNDPRVTKFGNIMRKARIDELPQLINVIKGEMSFIGPRPERMVFIKELEKQIPYYNLRHMVKPGLTGWAQVMYPYGASVEDARRKLEYDLYYIKQHSLYLDLVIMILTFKTVVFGKGR